MRIRLLLALMALFYFVSLVYTERARATLDGSDAWGYYVHLPAIFLYHDSGDYSKTIAAWQTNYPNRSDPRKDAYGLRPTPIGKIAVKYPMGVALLEAPFFALAHVFCLLSGSYPADGFSAPYTWAMSLSTQFFIVLGLFFVFKNLRYNFSENVSLAVTATFGLGTNLFFFGTYTLGMAHPVAFCLAAYLLLAVRSWYEMPNAVRGIVMGLTLGLIALVRTQDLLLVLVPVFWGIQKWPDVPARLRFWIKHRMSIATALLSFCCALLPQAFYWKLVSGKWWYYAYQNETFDWVNPHILEGLFSFQNGWFIYTPVMLLAIWGWFQLRRHAPELQLPLLMLLPLHWYISYAWWCWMYINGFGSRPMVDIYPLLAVPLAAWLASWRKKWLPALLFLFFIVLNIFQTWQVKKGMFWSERGNWAFYQAAFGQTSGSERALNAFESGEPQPKKQLERFRALMTLSVDTASNLSVQMGGRLAHLCKGEFHQTHTIRNDTAQLMPGDWIRVSVAGFVPAGQAAMSVDQVSKIVTDFSNNQDKVLKYRAINIATHLSNPRYTLWKTRGTGEWGEAAFFVRVPMGFDAGSRLTIYIWNPGGQEVYVGDLKAEIWR